MMELSRLFPERNNNANIILYVKLHCLDEQKLDMLRKGFFIISL